MIGEELGLVGIAHRARPVPHPGLRRGADRTRNTEPFIRLAAAGITAWIVAQALVNLGAVIGLLPIVGIPLPLLSYGGSALLPTLIAIGMLLSFARPSPGRAGRLDETRRPRTGG